MEQSNSLPNLHIQSSQMSFQVMRKKAFHMLSSDNLRKISQLPAGETEQDWITINRMYALAASSSMHLSL
jgi:hypothetical protein